MGERRRESEKEGEEVRGKGRRERGKGERIKEKGGLAISWHRCFKGCAVSLFCLRARQHSVNVCTLVYHSIAKLAAGGLFDTAPCCVSTNYPFNHVIP